MPTLKFSNYQYIGHNNTNKSDNTIREGLTLNDLDEFEDEYDNKYVKILNEHTDNKENINNSIRNIQTSPVYNLGYNDLETNKKFDQMIKDSNSIRMREKFLISLGAITVVSLIILGTQL